MAPKKCNKVIVTYDGGNVNGIHHTGGICHRGGKAIRGTRMFCYNAGDKSKANELTTLIANAKATIREQYPDADQPITD